VVSQASNEYEVLTRLWFESYNPVAVRGEASIAISSVASLMLTSRIVAELAYTDWCQRVSPLVEDLRLEARESTLLDSTESDVRGSRTS